MIPRWALTSLQNVLKEQRIAVVIGPRRCGKTTLVENAQLSNSEFVSLDIDSNLQAAKRPPNFFVTQRRNHCLIIDEIQKAPSLIGEIKYAVDHDERSGQFVLTGSSDYRKYFVRLRSFSTAVKMGAKPLLLSRIFGNNLDLLVNKRTSGEEFAVPEALVGGYLWILQYSKVESRARRFQSYLD